jgi:hypothetical protein
MGFLDAAKQSLTRSLEFDPSDRLNALGMALKYGVIPMAETEAAYAIKM